VRVDVQIEEFGWIDPAMCFVFMEVINKDVGMLVDKGVDCCDLLTEVKSKLKYLGRVNQRPYY